MKTVEELREEHLPHATAEVFGELPEGTMYRYLTGGDYHEMPVAEHAARFLPPQDDCPMCGNKWVKWSIIHGIAMCDECRWGKRLYHYFRAPGEDHDRRVVVGLWYHPELVEP